MKKVLFISPYPTGTAASQRFRFEQYFHELKKNGFCVDKEPFWSERAWKVLYQPGNYIKKALSLLKAIGKRHMLLFTLGKYDYIFIHREFSPVGLPFAVWIISKILGKKIIFDFDDAIWIPNVSESNRLFNFLKVYSNTRRIIKMSYKVSCGNEYLRNFALQYNPNAFYIPTTIDTENYHNQIRPLQHQPPFVIGWTGSHSTVRYLEEVVPVIQELEKKYPIEFRVISDSKPEWNIKCMKFISWTKEHEIEELLKFDIGLMPLQHDPWSEGKCGFKALQYMSLGIPALVSPLGVNTNIVDHGIDGFYCRTPAEWKKYIERFIQHPEELKEMSTRTRKKVEEHYSVKAISPAFLHLFS